MARNAHEAYPVRDRAMLLLAVRTVLRAKEIVALK